MGRKAKDAAQQKIGEWIGVRRNASKTTTKAKKSENTSAPPTEIRAPLKTQSPSDMNAMKNCTVRLEKMRADPKQIETSNQTPADDAPAATAATAAAAVATSAKDKETDKKNVYDYSFDGDDLLSPAEHENAMKDLIEKLAKENKIEVKKYRPKNVKKKKTDEKDPIKKTVTQKRQRERQQTDAEPPQKRPNLKKKQVSVVVPTNDALSSNKIAKVAKGPGDAANVANNNNLPKKPVEITKLKETAIKKPATAPSLRKQVATVNLENVNIQSRLRNRNNNFQSTPKSSTPINTKTAATKSKENNRSLFFDNASPLTNSARNVLGDVRRQRLQLSAINDSQEIEITSPNTSEKQNEPQPNQSNFDGDDFGFGDNAYVDNDDPPMTGPNAEMDKENSLDRPGTSASVSNAQNRPGTSTATSRSSWNRPGPSSAASTSRDRPTTSAAALASLNESNERSAPHNQSVGDSFNIYTPTKRRVYGRSPLKNITSEVNNTNSPSYESVKSVDTMPRSFGVLPKSTLNSIQSNNSKSVGFTLPEASHFSSRRAAEDFDRTVNDDNIIDECFGFDIGDEEEAETPNTESEQTSNNTKPEIGGLSEIRSKLKRFLHNPEKFDETVKKSKTNNNRAIRFKSPIKGPIKTPGKTPNKSASKTPNKTPAKTPKKTPVKTAKTPDKVKRNVFGETGAKQKDIRSAFATRSEKQPKAGSSKDDPAAALFEEIETVQDRRRSYSKPQRQRKRRISVDTDESEDEQNSDDEEYDGKKTKRAKRRKKAVLEPKDVEEFEDFAKKTNEHFEEIDSFVMMVE